MEEHAAIVRDIFRRYLELGNVRLVADALARQGIASPQRRTGGGKAYGGCGFTRGQLYAILKNPIYAGDIRHQGKLHKGLHSAIINRETWERVQAKLAAHLLGERRAAPAAKPSLLAGLLVDEAGEPLVATHACKGKVRYRYYVSWGLQHGGSNDLGAAIRMPAREIEKAVTERLAEALHDPLSLAARAWLVVTPGEVLDVASRAAAATAMANAERDPVRALVQQVRLLRGRIEIDVATRALANLLQAPIASEAPVAITLTSELRITRTGRAVRLIQNNGAVLGGDRPDPTLVSLVAKARSWWGELRTGDIDVPTLASREGVTQSYITRVARLAFLSPSVIDAILSGSQLAAVNGRTLTAPAAIPISWIEQRAIFQTRQLAES